METKGAASFNYFDLSSLRNVAVNKNEKQDESLRVMAKQLESVFLEMILKGMHETIKPMKSDLISSDREEFYQGMLNQQLSLTLSKAGGIGLADVIVKQLAPANKKDLFAKAEPKIMNLGERKLNSLVKLE